MENKKRIRTRIEVRAALKEFAEEKDSFTTSEAAHALRTRGGNVHINNNRVAQYLRGEKKVYYHKGLKRWVKENQ